MSTKINLLPVKKNINQNFESICRHNRDLKLEISAHGELIIMSPTGGETGNQNSRLNSRFVVWNESKEPNWGIVFDSSTCFRLPNTAVRSPDVAWIALERWNSLTLEQKKKFPPIAPDFVLELISESDNLRDTQAKMSEYMDAGVRLGWLINPQTKQVEIYRANQKKEILNNPSNLSGEDVLPGLMIDLTKIWP